MLNTRARAHQSSVLASGNNGGAIHTLSRPRTARSLRYCMGICPQTRGSYVAGCHTVSVWSMYRAPVLGRLIGPLASAFQPGSFATPSLARLGHPSARPPLRRRPPSVRRQKTARRTGPTSRVLTVTTRAIPERDAELRRSYRYIYLQPLIYQWTACSCAKAEGSAEGPAFRRHADPRAETRPWLPSER